MQRSAPTTTSHRVKLVCFDLGGVVIRICRSWAQGCAVAGIPHRLPEDPTRDLGPIFARLEAEHMTGRIDGATYADHLSAELGGLYSPAEIRAVVNAWMIGSYAGIERIIDVLHERGVQTAALSNTNDDHWRRINEFPAVDRLRHRFASHELGLLKPDAAIFRALETRLGVRSGEVLFFDDLPDNVRGAAAVGWDAVLVDPLQETAPQIEAALAERGVAP